MLGSHPARVALARVFGATDGITQRGEAAIERVRELTVGSARTPCPSASVTALWVVRCATVDLT